MHLLDKCVTAAIVVECVSVLVSDLLKMIAAALTDFADLNCYSALQLLLEVQYIILRFHDIFY